MVISRPSSGLIKSARIFFVRPNSYRRVSHKRFGTPKSKRWPSDNPSGGSEVSSIISIFGLVPKLHSRMPFGAKLSFARRWCHRGQPDRIRPRGKGKPISRAITRLGACRTFHPRQDLIQSGHGRPLHQHRPPDHPAVAARLARLGRGG